MAIVIMNLARGTVNLLRNRLVFRPTNLRLSNAANPSFSRLCKAHLKKYKVTYTAITLGVAGAGLLGAVTLPKLAINCKFLEPIPVSAEALPPSPSTNKSISDESADTTDSVSLGCGAFGAAYFNIRIPLLLGDLVNMLAKLSSSPSSPLSSLQAPSIRLCGAYSLQSLCTFAYIGFLATVGERVSSRLRCMLFERLIFQKVTFFDKTTTSWLLDRTVADVQAFKSAFKASISQGLRSGAQIIGSTVAMYIISPTLCAALIGCLPLVFLVGSLIGHQLRILSHQAQDQDEVATEVASETFMHIRSVKSLTMEPTMMASYSKEVTYAGHLHEILGYGIGCFQGLSNFVLNGVVLGVLYLGGNLIARNELEAGQLMSFLVATQSVHRSLTQISLLFGSIVRGMSAATRIAKVLATTDFTVLSLPGPDEARSFVEGLSDLPKLPNSPLTPLTAPTIKFENVSFAYPSRPSAIVFENLDFEIPGAKVVALVGESGAGKSTVLALLERFYDPTSGRIVIDGVDLRDFSLSTLRGRLLGYISQEPEVFHTTVYENIRCAQPQASDKEVRTAAELAQADSFIRHQLPEGYATTIGGGSSTSSVGLSGGQRQRLVIARAVLKNAPILLLDEATSALDAESEFQVQSALQQAMFGRTVLIVAHRLSTIRRADLIYVMHKGRIVEVRTSSIYLSNLSYLGASAPENYHHYSIPRSVKPSTITC
ncbi:unnamed protein product [Schistocephalus solidus]|uniref:Mitochondrial potassium channel ATP-binding subunit n=1 Tax=Schistocephalus solidus TaxID=70667 RepID=A0A183T0H8_SCHSO|nr:unnamed protein product [Schistocephalus solidus]